MKTYVDNPEANRQLNKIEGLVARGLSDEEIVRRFELDGEKNLAASGRLWSSRDVEKIRRSFDFRRSEGLKDVFLVLFLVVLVLGGAVGLFVAFACNGGAAGSSQMSAKAWECLLPYLVLYFMTLAGIFIIGRR